MFWKIKRALNNLKKRKSYSNYVGASSFIQFVRKIVGVSVYTLKISPSGLVTAHFTYLGFICFVMWYSTYFYCVYIIYYSDQTILRSLYNTKLLHYGDEVERISTTIFVLYTMGKLPFDMKINCEYVQELIDIDKAINSLGKTINYSKNARLAIVAAVAQMLISFARTLSIWMALANLTISIPLEKVFQIVHSDELALITTAQYCIFLHELKCRYKIVNRVLDTVETPETPVFNLLVATRKKKAERAPCTLQFQDKQASEKIKICGKIYGMLHNASETANSKFGLSIALTMFMCLILVVLYLFYFMEATASGLFHDFQKYANFLTHVFWQIGFAVGIIYLSVYFCENTVREAKITSFITHKIINSEMDPLVRREAVHLSLQVIHQLPSFTAHGLCRIDYVLLLEGSRTVVTFLVILLQFVADPN
ncbi:putative gustatory receptor 28b [Epargyreus clarus]|uniref:putative gustatory receptor 28b n=1 Tax=Epargyreus clarus TaxID=520877 RepID=UPI003C2C1612